MQIKCSIDTIPINEEWVYENRSINTGIIQTFYKAFTKPKRELDVEVPVIRFIFSRRDSKEWFFETEEQRDKVFDKIDKLLNIKEC